MLLQTHGSRYYARATIVDTPAFSALRLDFACHCVIELEAFGIMLPFS